MAANYWDSTQFQHWTFTKPHLASLRHSLLPQTPPPAPTSSLGGAPSSSAPAKIPTSSLPDPRHLAIFLQSQLHKLSRRLNLRQQALATAQVYLKRFYLSVPVWRSNPYLVLTTALYLACKVEESPQHIRMLVGEAARHWPEMGSSASTSGSGLGSSTSGGGETARVGECEFAMIATLGSALVCHHPYRDVQDFSGILGLGGEGTSLAMGIINDSFATDLPLLYPPHVLALTAIFLAVVLRPTSQPAGLAAHSTTPSSSAGSSTSSLSGVVAGTSTTPSLSAQSAQSALGGFASLFKASGTGSKLTKMVDFLAESQVDMDSVVDATQELVSLYECWEHYNERSVKEVVGRWVREGGGSK
jgi:cyclin-C